MTDGWAADLRDVQTEALDLALKGESAEIREPLAAMDAAAIKFSAAWSGSNLGYHADVYYQDFEPPPPGSHWSIEWGFHGMVYGSTGDWTEYRHDQVLELVEAAAGSPDREALRKVARNDRERLNTLRETARSILSGYLAFTEDAFLRSVEKDVAELKAPDRAVAVRTLMRTGDVMSRDALAVGQGWKPAPHQEVLADVVAMRTVYAQAGKLAALALRAADHLDRLAAAVRHPAAASLGTHVFIGHGRSLQWRVLKDFIQDRLHLPYMEFNRVPVAGVTNIARLSECLDQSGAAFLVLTAEDQRIDGEMAARQNVIHEVGLFQGRLGFTRAIVMLEEGCEEFSNIQGLGQIRYPKGQIEAAFEEVRRVLEREGMQGDTGAGSAPPARS